MKSIRTYLLFVGDQVGKAEEAIGLYTSLFANSEIVTIEHYGKNDDDREGLIKTAVFTLNGIEHMVEESSLDHAFTFTPAISLFVECESIDEIDRVFATLADGGKTLLPLDKYGASARFGWLEDKYGVNWQLNFTE